MGAVYIHRMSGVISLLDGHAQQLRCGPARAPEAGSDNAQNSIAEALAFRPALGLAEDPETSAIVDKAASFHSINAVKKRKLILINCRDIGILREWLDQSFELPQAELIQLETVYQRTVKPHISVRYGAT